jgi:hypothetical protein
MASDPLKVLLSYSHDSPEHQQRVLTLANRLRSDGIDCMIDQYVVVPAVGWTLWMEKQIEASDFVLMVCTETYFRRVRDDEESGKGLGVRWEGGLIYRALYRGGRSNTKFIPVLFETGDSVHIPGPVGDTNSYLVQTERGYEDLYRRLTNQPETIKPELGRLRSLPRAERKSEGAVSLESIFSNLPDRNPFFTGREHVMVQLHEALVAQGRVVLSGLGGVGKTQAAVEYSHRHFEEYAYIMWAPAHSHETLVSSYATIATILKLPEAGAQDQTAAVEAVKRWLGSNQGWLLILDNADDIVMARAFLPSGRKGQVILTTRTQAAGATARRVGIQEMETEEGALFLLRRATCIAGDASLDTVTESDRVHAEGIVAQLDGLPLALDQAAAYIEETSCGLSGYLNLCRSHAAELLRRRGRLSTDHLDPVSTTWVLSFENIEKANPAAAELLRFCAFLSADAIPEEMFSESATELGPELGAVASDPLAWNDALSEILKYSLLRRDRNTSTLEIHRLVQAVLKQAMDEANRRLWAERVVRAINRASPNIEFSTWPLCDRLLPQAHACAGLINQWGFGFPEAARLLNQAGFYLHERGRYTDAEPFTNERCRSGKRPWARSPPAWPPASTTWRGSTTTKVNTRRPSPFTNGRWRSLKRPWARSTPTWPTSLNNLAGLYDTQGQYGKAEPLYQRALAIREKALGPGAPRRSLIPQQPGGALQQPRPIREGRAPLPTSAVDL